MESRDRLYLVKDIKSLKERPHDGFIDMKKRLAYSAGVGSNRFLATGQFFDRQQVNF